jgi:H+/Cl- antiporter ClcA
MVLAIAASVLCAYIAPAAAGSGIPEVKAYLNGIDAHSILAPSTLFVKASNKLKLLSLSLSLSLSLYIYIYIYIYIICQCGC